MRIIRLSEVIQTTGLARSMYKLIHKV
ncbi:AlpA family phage regulatory protein [Pseudomonas mosselii]